MLQDSEIDLIINDLLEQHRYDFTYYARDSLKRRIERLFKMDRFGSVAELRHRLMHDKQYIDHFIDGITVNVTEMFRDANFYSELRRRILPELASLPVIDIWHAGCSTGEEVYSVAILLHETGLLERANIRATDINPRVLKRARDGVFSQNLTQLYIKNYQASGGERDFSKYYIAYPQGPHFNEKLRARMNFEAHNLASGTYLGRFDLIICRNVLIYFDKVLQDRVFKLFYESLSPGGYLALGEKETMRSSRISEKFQQMGKEKIWKKVL